MKKLHKMCFVVLLVSAAVFLTGKIYFYQSKAFLDFDYVGKDFYDAEVYLSGLGVGDEDYSLYYPTWLLIKSKADLKDNELGIDLSEVDLSEFDFDKNYALLTLGAKLRALRPYESKSVNTENEGFWVDVYVKNKGIDSGDIYIYKIDKYNIEKNMLMPPGGVIRG
ncbi:MAG: hypothetical protein LUD81_03335, partial [Clostridiales bacterium]|nr:hypothetical protein [Clostridiales bacterium]